MKIITGAILSQEDNNPGTWIWRNAMFEDCSSDWEYGIYEYVYYTLSHNYLGDDPDSCAITGKEYNISRLPAGAIVVIDISNGEPYKIYWETEVDINKEDIEKTLKIIEAL